MDVFTITINAVNDDPVIRDAGNNPMPDELDVAVDEGQEIDVVLRSSDVDNVAGDMRWNMDPDDLFNAYQLVDNNDGTATLTITPNLDAGRIDPYVTVITLSDGNNGTDELTVNITVNNINQGPVITDDHGDPIPDGDILRYRVFEGQQVQFTLFADDPDLANIPPDVLQWEMSDQDGLPDPVDDNWNLDDQGDGTVIFTWTPPFDASRFGGYWPEFRVSDEADEEDRIYVEIWVRNENQPPRVVQQIPDVVVDEDEDLDDRPVVIIDLDDVFDDPDTDRFPNHDLNLTFGFDNPPPAELNMDVNNNGELVFDADENFNIPNGVEITLTAEDPEGLLTWTAFTLTINPVNDAPGPFNILSPEDGFEIDPDSLNNEDEPYNLTFEWEEAIDPDAGDDVLYELLVNVSYGEIDIVIGQDSISETTYTIEDLRSELIANGIVTDWEHRGISIEVLWWVEARDAEEVIASEDIWMIILPIPWDVPGEDPSLPKEYSLSPVYPNPFNPTARLDFALPKPSDVRITVWDMTGRRVETLVFGELPAGRFKTQWSSANLPAGLYLFTLDAEGVRIVRKGVLVK